MARLKFGALVVAARGTIGGVIYSQNKSGPYARIWSRGAAGATAGQSTHRATIGTYAAAWAGLTELQRSAWDVYAADPAQEKTDSLGESYYASGFQWFVAINTGLRKVGRASTNTPPAGAAPGAPTISTFVPDHDGSPDSVITYPGGTFGAGEDLVLFIALSQSGAVASAPSNRRLVLAKQSPGATQETFQDEFLAAFPSAAAGQRAFAFLFKQSSEGRRGAVATAAALVA